LAQMPHRVAVLVNENSQNSKKAANVFAALHGVPGGNLIYLNLPDSMVTGRAECSPEEFISRIYEPAQKTIEERGLTEQVLAWVYSVDFPIRIVTSPNDRQQMSLMGITFTRGKVPAMEMIEKGQFASTLFAGPLQEGGPKNPPRSFDVISAALKERMPLPAMMLGYTGEKGTDMDTVLRCIENGVRARQGIQNPQILLVQTGDKARSGPREWQYADVKAELALRGGSAVICTNPPSAQTNLTGVLIGAETVKPADFGTFAPGAFAEHLTSWSAEFQKPQTKCTEWLKAGATVTAGMVTEPYNAWPKFPHARFFVHYASGCSAMESFYQSILSPVQVLLLGDPLSQIAGLPVEIKTVGLGREIASSVDSAFVAEAKFPIPAQPLYTREEAEHCLSQITPVSFNEIFNPVPGISARFISSGGSGSHRSRSNGGSTCAGMVFKLFNERKAFSDICFYKPKLVGNFLRLAVKPLRHDRCREPPTYQNDNCRK